MTLFIDNGTTGSVGAVKSDGSPICFWEVPTVKLQDYTKAKKNVTRIDVRELYNRLDKLRNEASSFGENLSVFLERPMINPTRFTATISAVRALEATITVLEALNIGYQFVDSKEWQKGLLPSSRKKGTDSKTLKQESHDIGIRMFPEFEELIHKHKDADGILGAYALNRR